jgi:hypothetical protein
MQSKCIYYKKLEGTFSLSPELVGCFFSAVNTFAKSITQDQINAIVMGETKIFFQQLDEHLDLFLIVVADRGDDDTKLRKIIEETKIAFLKVFPLEKIIEYSTQPNYFESFDDALNPILFKKNQPLIKESHYETNDLPLEKKLEVKADNINLPLLFKSVKDLGKVIFSLFVGKRIVVAGKPGTVQQIIDTFEIFSPHHKLKKVYWADDPDKSYADIMGAPRDLANLCLDSTIVDLESNKVTGITTSNYLDRLVKRIQKQPLPKATSIINETIYSLIRMRSIFSEFIEKNSVSDSELKVFMKNIDPDSLNIIEAYYCWNFPNYSEKVNEFCNRIKILSLAKGFLV